MPKRRVYKSLRDTIALDHRVVPVRITVERRDNCSASIGKKAVHIHLPAHAPAAERLKLLEQMKEWARKRLTADPGLEVAAGPRAYADGDTLRIGGIEFLIRIFLRDRPNSRAELHGRVIAIELSSGAPEQERARHAAALIARCVAGHRRPDLIRRINDLNQKHFNRPIRNITFKNMSTQWGSCSAAGNINISSRLLFAPDDVLDYICIHELAHLVEQNHSPAFWALVEKAVPDYKEKKKWLKDHGRECRF